MSDTASLELVASGDREIVVTRVFDAPRALVYDALTKPELLKRWLTGPPGWTMPVCEVDLRVGGKLRIVWRGADGTEMGMSGVYREITPPGRLVHTELFDTDWTGGETLVTNVLTEHDGQTSVTMTILYTSRETRDAVLRSGMAQGLAASYDRLAERLASSGPAGI